MSERITTLLRFNEETGSPPRDSAGGLDDLFPRAGSTAPTRVVGPLGIAMQFLAAAPNTISALDLITAGTLHTRDVTVQTLIAWDSNQGAGTVGAIITRGLGNAASDYHPFGLELRVISPRVIGEVRFVWQTSAGVLKIQTGAHFTVPLSDFSQSILKSFLLTATRHWVSPTEVQLRYYVNGDMVGEVTSVDGDIGGGVSGRTVIGARTVAGVDGNYLNAAISELAIAEYAMSREEIEATWKRIAIYQPDGYRVMKDLYPPGAPISDDPASEVQTDIRLMGGALGFADGLIENMRDNIMPDRAYGEVLRRWERTTSQPAKPLDGIDRRRSRVVGQVRKRGGVAPPSVMDALAELLACSASQLEVIAFDNTFRDDWAAIEAQRWTATAGWDVIGAAGRVQAAAGTYTWDEAHLDGRSLVMPVQPPRSIDPTTFNGVSIYASLDPQLLPANAEAGFVLWDWAAGHMLFFGLRNVAGAIKVGYQRFRDRVAIDGAFVVLATTALQKHFLRIRPPAESTMGGLGSTDQNYQLSYSVASGAEADLITAPDLLWSRSFGWAGFYFRTNGAIASAVDARFGSDFALRNTKGTRPFYWYVYRDPALPGVPDLPGARAVLKRMRHGFTHTAIITSKSLLCNVANSGCNEGPMGALLP